MNKHRNRATPRELDALNAFLLLERRKDEKLAELNRWANTLPAATLKVAQDAVFGITAGRGFSIPSDMPECDAQDVLRRLSAFEGIFKAMKRKEAEAGALV